MGFAGDGVSSREERAYDVNAASFRGDGDDDGGMIFGAIAAVILADDRLSYARMYACTCVHVSSATRFDLAGQSHRGEGGEGEDKHASFALTVFGET